MTGKRTRFFAVTALLLLLVPQGRKTAPASAQTAAGQPPSVAVYQLENRGTDASTVTVVGDLLFSFIREMRDYRLDFLDTTLPQSQANGSADGEKAVSSQQRIRRHASNRKQKQAILRRKSLWIAAESIRRIIARSDHAAGIHSPESRIGTTMPIE